MNETITRQPIRRVILFAVGAALVLFFGFFSYTIWQRTNLNAEESAHRALLSEVHTHLEQHHHDRGSYPRSLSELQITNFQDGATPAMLQQFRYESDGTTYTLHYFGVASRQTIIFQSTAQRANQ